MFKLHDIRKSKVWQEAFQVGYAKGLELGRKERRDREIAQRLRAKGWLFKDIAEVLDIPLADVRRFARAK